MLHLDLSLHQHFRRCPGTRRTLETTGQGRANQQSHQGQIKPTFPIITGRCGVYTAPTAKNLRRHQHLHHTDGSGPMWRKFVDSLLCPMTHRKPLHKPWADSAKRSGALLRQVSPEPMEQIVKASDASPPGSLIQDPHLPEVTDRLDFMSNVCRVRRLLLGRHSQYVLWPGWSLPLTHLFTCSRE